MGSREIHRAMSARRVYCVSSPVRGFRRRRDLPTFVRPGRRECLGALGPLTDLPDRLQRLLDPGGDFEPVSQPHHGDWLDVYDESGQTFEEYVMTAFVPESHFRRVYFVPLEGPSAISEEWLARFRRYAEAFFTVEVCMLPPRPLDDGAVARRTDPEWGLYQWCAADVLRDLAANRPDDAWSVLALTGADIYPHALVDYTFGLASYTERVGVCSVARFSAPYCREASVPNGRFARRACRLIAHEIGHLLGLRHCVYYACLMNGSTSLAEGDTRPLHLCPIDLRKLQWLLGFDVDARYRDLAAIWREFGASDETSWILRRLSL